MLLQIFLVIPVAMTFYLIGRYLNKSVAEEERGKTQKEKGEIPEKQFNQKPATILATIIGIIMLIFFIWLLATYWKDIDWFQGRGGNPQEDYLDY